MENLNDPLVQMLTHCAKICEECVAACLQEKDVEELKFCIRLDLACASLCRTAASFTIYKLENNATYELCADICRQCAKECDMHSHHDHCKECAQVCMECADACSRAIMV